MSRLGQGARICSWQPAGLLNRLLPPFVSDDSYTTIHAGSARQALTRLRFVAQLADTSSELPLTALNSLVSESIDVVVHSARIDGRVQVTEIIAVEDLQGGADAASFTTTSLFVREGSSAELTWTGNIPSRALRALAGAGYDIRARRGNTSSTERVS